MNTVEINWQDIMKEHCREKDWVAETQRDSIVVAGRLCETILKLEAAAKKYQDEIA